MAEARAQAEASLGHTAVELMAIATAAQAEIGAAQARQAVALARVSAIRDAEAKALLAFAGRIGSEDLERVLNMLPANAAAEFGAAAGLSTGAANLREWVSCRLATSLPRTLALLESGRLDWDRAATVVNETQDLQSAADLAAVEHRLLSDWEDNPNLVMSRRALRDRVRAAVAEVDPDALRKRHDRKVRERGVWIEQLSDGMAKLIAQGPAASVQVAYEMLVRLSGFVRDQPVDVAHETDSAGEDFRQDDAAGAEHRDAAGHGSTEGDGYVHGESGTDSHGCTDEEGCAGHEGGVDDQCGADHEPGTGHESGASDQACADDGHCVHNEQCVDDEAGTDCQSCPDGGSHGGHGWSWGRLLDLAAGGISGWDPAPTRAQPARDRFDVLELLAHALMTGPGTLLSTSNRVRPVLQLVMTPSSLAGFDDSPATLQGVGPIPAHVARLLAADSVWRRVITDPVTGVLTDLDTHRYVPSTLLRHFLRTRDQACTFPGCTRPSIGPGIEFDHLLPFPRGQTHPNNLGPACGLHHLVKTHQAGWRVRRTRDGHIRWTTPTGLVRDTPPSRLAPLVAVGLPAGDLETLYAELCEQIEFLDHIDLGRYALPPWERRAAAAVEAGEASDSLAEPVAGEPGTGEPGTGAPVAGESGAGESVTGELTDDSATGGPGTGESGTDESGTDESGTDDSATDDSATGEPVAGEPLTDDSATDDSATGDSATDDSVAGESGTGEPLTNDSATGDLVTGESVMGEDARPAASREGSDELFPGLVDGQGDDPDPYDGPPPY